MLVDATGARGASCNSRKAREEELFATFILDLLEEDMKEAGCLRKVARGTIIGFDPVLELVLAVLIPHCPRPPDRGAASWSLAECIVPVAHCLNSVIVASPY